MASPRPLPASTPSAEGVDAAGILALVEALDADPGQDPHGLMILRHGRVIAQGWWAPYSAERPQLVYSLSKSFTAAAAGTFVDEGVLGLDDPVVTHFPEFADDIVDERSRRITVRHVASMASGHETEMIDAAFGTDPAEPVRGFLLNPPGREPGSVFAYSQPTTYTLAAIVQRLAGKTLVEVLRERVLGPIGAGPIAWAQWPAGRCLGFSGAFVTTDTIARLGQLLLRRGEWDGRRILSEEWVDAATSQQIAMAPDWADAESDWACGYGLQHWISRHGYRGDGACGQYCVVLPEHDMVIAYQGQTDDLQGVLDAFWTHVLPAVDRSGDPGADAVLAARLAAVTLPERTVARAALSADDVSWWDGADFAAADDGRRDGDSAGDAAADDGDDRRGGHAARVRRAGDAWTLTLVGRKGDLDAQFTAEPGWTVTEGRADPAATPAAAAGGVPAVAVSGGFASPDRLELDLAFLETPHRLHVELDRIGGTATTRWQVPPLEDGRDLRKLAAPGPFG